MAKSETRRPTPREKVKPQKQPRAPKAPKPKKPAKTKAPKPAKVLKAPKLTKPAKPEKPVKPEKPKALKPQKRTDTPASSPRAAAPSRGATPALLNRAARAAKATVQRPTTSRERRQRHQRGKTLRYVAIGAASLLGVALVLVIAFFILRDSSVFRITSVEVEPTQHITVNDIRNLTQIPEGTTLLNLDEAALESSIRKNPWVGSVSIERVFPNTLKVTIAEQKADMLVVMSSGSVAWYLGDAGVWIQPTRIEAAEGQSVNDAALQKAQAEGCLLVIDVPSTVDPKSGSAPSDGVLQSVQEFREGFSEEFSSHIACYSAASTDDIWCTMDNGVSVSLGSATDIAEKEHLVESYLDEFPDTALYIVVRVVSNPSVRTIDSELMESGEGLSPLAGLEDAKTTTSATTQDQNPETGQDAQQSGDQSGEQDVQDEAQDAQQEVPQDDQLEGSPEEAPAQDDVVEGE